MASSRTVQYIFELIDKITPNSKKLAQSAAEAEKKLANMGKATTEAEAKLKRLGQSVADTERSLSKVGTARPEQTYERVAQAADKASRSTAELSRQQSRFAFGAKDGPFSPSWYRQARLENQQLERQLAASARRGGGGALIGGGVDRHGRMRHRDGRFMPMGFGSGSVVEGAVTAHLMRRMLAMTGGTLMKSEDVLHIERQMAAVGTDPRDIKAAVTASSRIASLYRNLNQAEVLGLSQELRGIFGTQAEANLHLEPIAKKLSFLRAYEGGKHGAKGAQAITELLAAAQSAELAGKIHEPEFSQHLDWLVAAKTTSGERLSIKQMLTAQKQALGAMMGVDDSFRYGTFTALVQAMGVKAGSSFQAFSNKMVSGLNWKKLGLQEGSDLGLWKEGERPEQSAIAKIAKTKPDMAALEIMRAIGEKYGSDPATIRTHLARLMGTTNAAAFPQEVINNWSRILKEWESIKKAHDAQVKGGLSFFDDDALKNLDAVHKSWDDLLQKLTRPLNPAVNWALTKTHGILDWLGRFFERHPAIATAAAGAGMAAMAGAGLFLGRYGLQAMGLWGLRGGAGLLGGALQGAAGAGLAAVGAGGGVLKLLGGAVATVLRGSIIGVLAYAAGMLLTSDFAKGIYKDVGDWMENNKDWQKRKADYDKAEKDFDARAAAGEDVGTMQNFGRKLWDSISKWMFPTAFDAGPGFDAESLMGMGMMMRGLPRPAYAMPSSPLGYYPTVADIQPNDPRFSFNGATSGIPPASAGAGGIPQSEATKEVTVRTTIDPIKIENGELRVKYEGPLGGDTSVQIRAPSPRGESAPVNK